MEIIKVVAFAFIALFMILLLKEKKQSIAVLISIAAGVLIFLFIVPKLAIVMNFLQSIANKTKVDFVYINTIFKILAIAYLATFCSEVCKDAGERSLAAKVEFAGKIFILTLGIPILMAVLQAIINIM